jgi:prepilin peptidase CpaA
MASVAVFWILPAAFLVAAFSDLTRYTIPNWLTGAIALAFPLVAIWAGLPPVLILIHIGVGIFALGMGMFFFALGWLGGGDAKLVAGAALWAGPHAVWAFALMAALAGGVLTVALIFFRKLPLPKALATQEWIARLHDQNAGIPYGVALAAGALYALPFMTLSQMLTS